MILCLVVEAIVILTLVVIIGWNKGVGDWMESLQKPVVRKLEMSGINSPYAVLMQVKGGKIIGNMKGDEKIYPASMTKIMTVIVAIENLDDLDQEITLTQEMFQGLYEQDATQAGFQPGETVRAIDLLYGAMLPSGAECCIALADTVGGSRDGFVELMNKKAQRIGMNGTHFCDTTGLHDPDHYSITTAKEQNYEAFYGQEIEYRKMMRYPPVWNMLYILCASKNEAAASEAAVALMGKIDQIVRENSEKIFSIGPSDAPVAKISDVYRKVIYVKTREYQTLVILKDGLEAFIKDNRLYQNVAVGFDFNPVNGF